ncbi:hypothetical protein [Cryobacterium sp. CG_9.6]|uniref:hypothetical protein n=1 Tax=Cryobacterium sp. CG_9.6 TaxID=2760710 RepID=UPI00247665E9|nr:hypothetical protein [Cryobacterium sp. CG_9.6]MDH6238422.1 hypothetical protein [Cryobacterium sp. CG_9.6]
MTKPRRRYFLAVIALILASVGALVAEAKANGHQTNTAVLGGDSEIGVGSAAGAYVVKKLFGVPSSLRKSASLDLSFATCSVA